MQSNDPTLTCISHDLGFGRQISEMHVRAARTLVHNSATQSRSVHHGITTIPGRRSKIYTGSGNKRVCLEQSSGTSIQWEMNTRGQGAVAEIRLAGCLQRIARATSRTIG
ncbi:hypothetical protein BC834DRAFT_275052 [Gloeopeniophorella convolvens]|nr:hypothetical protein BC834DRAFT_275052 [Gloeopeniophorella convolvens]